VAQWFSLSTPVSSTNKTDLLGVTEIFLKIGFDTLNVKPASGIICIQDQVQFCFQELLPCFPDSKAGISEKKTTIFYILNLIQWKAT
jgi:hypothetical protein